MLRYAVCVLDDQKVWGDDGSMPGARRRTVADGGWFWQSSTFTAATCGRVRLSCSPTGSPGPKVEVDPLASG